MDFLTSRTLVDDLIAVDVCVVVLVSSYVVERASACVDVLSILKDGHLQRVLTGDFRRPARDSGRNVVFLQLSR